MYLLYIFIYIITVYSVRHKHDVRNFQAVDNVKKIFSVYTGTDENQ